MGREIVLASISPRRRELMKLLKIKFKAVDSGYEEVMHRHLPHDQLVEFLALGKAKSAAKKYSSSIIISADTIVSFQGKAIGKPKNKSDLLKMLKSFSGKPQEAVTGTVVLDARSGKVFSDVSKVKIVFRKLSQKEILEYAEDKQAYDKAGGYGPIDKGINLLQSINNDYTIALGLPVSFVLNSLIKLGVKV